MLSLSGPTEILAETEATRFWEANIVSNFVYTNYLCLLKA